MSPDTACGSREAPAERFIVPRDPRLRWSMLSPIPHGRPLPRPPSGRPTFHLFWARSALYHGLRTLALSATDSVLVPAFHCTSVVEPLLQYGVQVRFYNVHRDCSADLEDIRAKIDPTTRAVLAIHYFGFPQPIRAFRRLCDEHKLFLIEDCAHVLNGEFEGEALGSFGDIAIFSWRKCLPLHDGGQLVVNNSDLRADVPLASPSLLSRVRTLKSTIDKLVDDSRAPLVRRAAPALRMISALGRRLFSAGPQPSLELELNNYSLDFDLSFVDVPMSGLSQRILRNIDLPQVVQARRRHYQDFLEAARALPQLVPFFPVLPDGICPWVFPFVVPGWKDFHLEVRARGIPAVTWGDVVHPDLSIHDFPDAEFLYRSLVLLPIHQSLTEAERRTMVSVIQEVLTGAR